ncbi:adenosine receptor A3-like [Montipora foliosa]|uniref:adenosine receptor A3-like n=1 Tax=Montipora foliosa TaxID=591990 RepID=UPI0035F111D9
MNPNNTKEIYRNVTNSHLASFCLEESGLNWDSNQPIFALSLVAIGVILQPIIVLLNVSVIIVVKRRKELQQNYYILLASMAIADLLTVVMMLPLLVIATLLIFGQVSFERVCVLVAINRNVMACMMFSSIYHLATVAWDMYVAVKKWKDYKVIVTKRRLKCLAKVCWTAAVVTTVPGTIMDLKTTKLLVVNPSIIYRGFIAISTMTSIIYFYVLIYLTLRKRKADPTTRVTTLVQAKLQHRVAKTTALITVALLVSMILPAAMSRIRLIYPAYRAILTLMIMGIASTGQLNAVFNPLLYCYRDRRFKKAVLELLRIKKPRVIYPVSSPNPQKNAQRSRRAKPRENRSQSLTKSSSCHLSDGRIRKKLVKRSMSSPAFSL